MTLPLSSVAMLTRYFGVVWRFGGGPRVLLLLGLMIATAFSEAFGITLFLPFLAQMEVARAGEDAMSRLIARMFGAAGVEQSATSVMLIIIAVFLAKGCLAFSVMVYQAYINSRLFQSLRMTLAGALASTDYQFALQRNTGYFTNVMTLEVARAVTFFSIYLTVLSYLINLTVFLGISFLVNSRFTTIAIVFGAVVLFGFGFIAGQARRYSRRISAENARVQTLVIETVQAFKYLASTAGFGPLLRRLAVANQGLVGLELRMNAVSSVIHGFSESIVITGMMALVYYEVVFSGRAMSSILVPIMLFYRSMMAITGVQKNWQNLSTSTGSIETVLGAITDLELHRETHGVQPFSTLTQGIELRNVSFAYAERPILRNLNLRIPSHAIVGIVGESGVGKSTLVDLITGTIKPTSGAVLVDGMDLRQIDPAAWRRRIGYVTQDGVLFDDTVAQNISLWTLDEEGRAMAGVEQSARNARCETFIAAQPEGYGALIGDRGVRLSGGQRQRLSIARELYKRPDLLILDEATSALDTELERDIQGSIDALQGVATVIIIAHRLSTVRGCDRIFVLDDGRLVEEGSFRDLLDREGSIFARMCGLQSVG